MISKNVKTQSHKHSIYVLAQSFRVRNRHGIEKNCTFYKIASQTIQKYLPYNDALFKKITHFDPAKICEEKDYNVLLSRFEDIFEVTTTLNVEINNVALKKAWR